MISIYIDLYEVNSPNEYISQNHKLLSRFITFCLFLPKKKLIGCKQGTPPRLWTCPHILGFLRLPLQYFQSSHRIKASVSPKMKIILKFYYIKHISFVKNTYFSTNKFYKIIRFSMTSRKELYF